MFNAHIIEQKCKKYFSDVSLFTANIFSVMYVYVTVITSKTGNTKYIAPVKSLKKEMSRYYKFIELWFLVFCKKKDNFLQKLIDKQQ